MSKRKILTTIILPALLISALMIIIINNQRELHGELVLEENHHDFGIVPEWEGRRTQTLTARNIGNKDIHITSIQTGCSYAEIEAPTMIPPETEVTLKVIINPQTLPDGTTTATAIIFTDSKLTPQVYITITTTAKRYATLSAQICDFGSVKIGSMYERKVKLTINIPINEKEIQLLPTDSPYLKWKIAPTSSPNSYHVTIQLQIPKSNSNIDSIENTDQMDELFSSLLTIAFPNQRTLTLPISARIVQLMTIRPESLSYGLVKRGTTPTLEFTLRANTEFKVLDIQSPDYLTINELSNSKIADEDTSQFEKRYKVTLNLLHSPSYIREEIYITTTLLTSPTKISVYGYIQPEKSNNPSSPMSE